MRAYKKNFKGKTNHQNTAIINLFPNNKLFNQEENH